MAHPRHRTRVHLRPLAVHPLLFAAFEVLYLWARNIQELIPFSEVVRPLLAAMAAAAVVTLALTFLLRSPQRAAVIASALVLVFFSYGYLSRALAGVDVGGFRVDHPGLLWAMGGLLLAAAGVPAVRARGRLPRLTQTLNVVACGLVLINAATIVMYQLHVRSTQHLAQRIVVRPPAAPALAAPPEGPLASPADQVDRLPEHPDIYYLILDEYAGERTLRDQFGYDNAPFLDFLAGKGFYVAGRSTTNYPRTILSVASSLNMQYLDFLTKKLGEDSGDAGPLVSLLQDHQVGHVASSLGYRYIHIGSWWHATAASPIADVNVTFGAPSEFSQVLGNNTALAPVAGEDFRHAEWKRVLFQFDALENIKKFQGPRFVFAHLLVPHDPFIFDRNGTFVSGPTETQRGKSRAYVDQLIYVNQRVRQLVDHWLSVPESERPVIIIQSDEGPYAGEPTYWGRPYPDALERKFEILNAYYLPGVDPAQTPLTPTVTPVNSFRIVFNLYFDAGLPLLPDRNYTFFDLHHPYRFTDVTQRVRELIGVQSCVGLPCG